MFRTISRQIILASAFVATSVAAVWPLGWESSVPEVVGISGRSNDLKLKIDPTIIDEPGLAVLSGELGRHRGTMDVENLFATTARTPPRPPTRRPQISALVAPPFPYAIAGTLADNDMLTVVFVKQNQHFVLRAGEMLDDTYRVDEVDARSVTVTHLPLGLKQSLPTGAP